MLKKNIDREISSSERKILTSIYKDYPAREKQQDMYLRALKLAVKLNKTPDIIVWKKIFKKETEIGPDLILALVENHDLYIERPDLLNVLFEENRAN
jgi:hypothetical protein